MSTHRSTTPTGPFHRALPSVGSDGCLPCMTRQLPRPGILLPRHTWAVGSTEAPVALSRCHFTPSSLAGYNTNGIHPSAKPAHPQRIKSTEVIKRETEYTSDSQHPLPTACSQTQKHLELWCQLQDGLLMVASLIAELNHFPPVFCC